MLPIGLKLSEFNKVKKLIFQHVPFDIEDELSRESKIFGIKYQPSKKNSIKKNAAVRTTKKNKKISL